MSGSSSNSQNTQSGSNFWLGIGGSLFGGAVSAMNSFSLAHIKNAPMPGYMRAVVSSFALMKDLATGGGDRPSRGQ